MEEDGPSSIYQGHEGLRGLRDLDEVAYTW